MIGATGYRPRLGTPAQGFHDPSTKYIKVAIGWPRDTLDAINRRVVKHKSSFAKEVRRLIEIGLQMDHLNEPSAWRDRMKEIGHHGY